MLKPNLSNQLKRRQKGFTLLESLVAIVVVTTLVAGISPMIVLAVASRVQARRSDVAIRVAKDYIEGVRSGAIPIPVGGTVTIDNPATTTVAENTETTPARCLNKVAAPIPATYVRVVGDYVIQPIRNGITTTTAFPNETTDPNYFAASKQGFDLVVRVYNANAFDTSNNYIPLKDDGSVATATADIDNLKVPARLGTSGIGNKSRVLAVVTGDAINVSSSTDKATTLTDYNFRLTSSSTACP